ncbi:hypothetical protein ACHAWF_004586, partial [Thalassiosira exigua]
RTQNRESSLHDFPDRSGQPIHLNSRETIHCKTSPRPEDARLAPLAHERLPQLAEPPPPTLRPSRFRFLRPLRRPGPAARRRRRDVQRRRRDRALRPGAQRALVGESQVLEISLVLVRRQDVAVARVPVQEQQGQPLEGRRDDVPRAHDGFGGIRSGATRHGVRHQGHHAGQAGQDGERPRRLPTRIDVGPVRIPDAGRVEQIFIVPVPVGVGGVDCFERLPVPHPDANRYGLRDRPRRVLPRAVGSLRKLREPTSPLGAEAEGPGGGADDGREEESAPPVVREEK